MRFTPLEVLRSEVGTLEGFLNKLTKNDFIMRMQLEHQLSEARRHLAEEEKRPQPKSLPITFRGQPVEGTRSIDASFATQALKAFIEMIDTIAASISGELKDRGPIPKAGGRSLRIAGTAVGSFGFELELPPLPPNDDDSQGELLSKSEEIDPYADAITTTLSLLDKATRDDDEALSELVAEVHPRAAKKVLDFAKILANHGALFATSFEGKQVRFDKKEQVQHVIKALKSEEIGEEELRAQGTLLGILPNSRAFEARLADGELIRGKVERALQDIPTLKKTWEGVEASLCFRIAQVRAKRGYVLTAVEALDATPS